MIVCMDLLFKLTGIVALTRRHPINNKRTVQFYSKTSYRRRYSLIWQRFHSRPKPVFCFLEYAHVGPHLRVNERRVESDVDFTPPDCLYRSRTTPVHAWWAEKNHRSQKHQLIDVAFECGRTELAVFGTINILFLLRGVEKRIFGRDVSS